MTDEFFRNLDAGYMLMVIVIFLLGFILFGAFYESYTISEFKETATCEQLFEKIENSGDAVLYNSKWIEKECWK